MPCDFTGKQHVYVDGQSWTDIEVSTHWHALKDAYDEIVYSSCTIYKEYICTEQRCPCGVSKTKKRLVDQLHVLD